MNKNCVNFRIKVFGIGWWLYMAATTAELYCVSMLGNRMESTDERFRFILILSVIELIILRVYKFSLKNIRDDYNYFNELPCYLCNQSTLMCIAAAFTRNTPIMAYCTSIGTFGAILAMVMPDRYNRDQLFFSKQAFGFYGYHCLLLITCLSFRLLKVYETSVTDSIYVMAWTFVLVITAHMVNVLMVQTGLNRISNFIFTLQPDNAILQKLWDRFPKPLWYLLPLLPLLGLASAVMFAII